MTSNVFSVAGSLGAKAYLKQNPPKLDVELKELGIDDESAGVKIPATLEEALVDAMDAADVRSEIGLKRRRCRARRFWLLLLMM